RRAARARGAADALWVRSTTAARAAARARRATTRPRSPSGARGAAAPREECARQNYATKFLIAHFVLRSVLGLTALLATQSIPASACADHGVPRHRGQNVAISHGEMRRVSQPWAGTAIWYSDWDSALPTPTIIVFDDVPLL